MKPGPHTALPDGRIDYKKLRGINPQAARRTVLEYLKTNESHITRTAQLFGINGAVVYDIINKDREGDLRDRSRAPRRQPRKTPVEITGRDRG